MEAIEYKEVNESAFADTHIYAKIKLDDGTIVTVKAYLEEGKWDYIVSPCNRRMEAIWAFQMLFMCVNG